MMILASPLRILSLVTFAVNFPNNNAQLSNNTNADTHISNAFDIDKMSVSDLRLLSNMTTWEDVISFLGINASGPELPDRLIPGTEKVPEDVTDGSSSAIVIDGEPALCRPELRTVELNTPPGVLYFPSCVRLDRCGGCCVGDLLSCQPTETQAVLIKVKKLKYNERGRPTTVYEKIEEEQHLACACSCQLQAHHCDPDTQIYRDSHCDCVCKDSPLKSWCLASTVLHVWDHEKCKCQCRQPKVCGTGEIFHHKTCRCIVEANEETIK